MTMWVLEFTWLLLLKSFAASFVIVLMGYFIFIRIKRSKDETYEFFYDNKERKTAYIKPLTIAFLKCAEFAILLSLMLYVPIKATFNCGIDGAVRNSSTEYSWVRATCLVYNDKGALIPLILSRGIPDGRNDSSSATDDGLYQ